MRLLLLVLIALSAVPPEAAAMRLLVHTVNRTIHDAQNTGTWQVPPGFEVVELEGDADTFPWPNGHPTRAMLDASGQVVANPAWTAREATRTDAEAQERLNDKALRALAEWLAGQLKRPPGQVRSEILSIYKGLP